MARLNKEILRHPVAWWKGADLPEEQIRPWEGGIQFLAEALKGFMGGYTGMKDLLYLGEGEGMIPFDWKKSASDVTRIVWDALNDPPIGAYMDRKRFGEKVHRWIMRFNATFSPFLILLTCLDLGLSPLSRLILWTLVAMFGDIMSTVNSVSESKIWAGITPHAHQRGILQTYKGFGGEISQAFNNIPLILMGLKDLIGLSDYQIMIYGALIFTPLTIFCRWLPSYAKQRVDFTLKVKGEDETKEQTERPPNLRECFAVVKHNRWFLMNTIVGLFTMFVPGTSYMHLWRFLAPKLHVRDRKTGEDKEIGGEVLYGLKSVIFATPSVLLQPFAVQVVKKFGSDLRFLRAQKIIMLAACTIKFFGGYKSIPRLVFMSLMEFVEDTFARWGSIPSNRVDYQMFDYVEWKTGQRSEGMTMAVSGMINKLIKSNVGSVFSNMVMKWTQFKGYSFPVEEQPPRFLKSIWPLLHIAGWGVFGVQMIALLWFKYPHDPKAVEADLIERRALAQKIKEEAEMVE